MPLFLISVGKADKAEVEQASREKEFSFRGKRVITSGPGTQAGSEKPCFGALLWEVVAA